MSGEELIYIVGVGRSGTSLLQRMLNAHSEICFLPEIHFFKRFLANKRVVKKYAKKGYPEFVRYLSEDEWFSRLGISASDIPHSSDEKENFDPVVFYRKLVACVQEQSNKKYVGEKDPRVLENLQQLDTLFQGACVLHIIRDPRDVMLSKMKASWSAKKGFILNLMLTQAQLEHGCMAANRIHKCHELSYEQLTDDPQGTLASVCDFIGVSYEPKMLEYHLTDDGLISDKELQWKENAKKPVMSRNSNKWITEFSALQIALTERVCRRAFDGGRYTKSGSYDQCSVVEKAKIMVIQVISKMFTVAYPVLSRYL